jgi:hypothetical protein
MSNKTQFSNKRVYEQLCDISDNLADTTAPIIELAMNTRFDNEEEPYNWRKEVVLRCYDLEQNIISELLRLAKFCYDRTEVSLRIEDFQDFAAITLDAARELHELRKYVVSSKERLEDISAKSKTSFKDTINKLAKVNDDYDEPYQELLKLSADLSEYAYPDV